MILYFSCVNNTTKREKK